MASQQGCGIKSCTVWWEHVSSTKAEEYKQGSSVGGRRFNSSSNFALGAMIALFVNWYFVKSFCITNRDQKRLFVRVHSSWFEYEGRSFSCAYGHSICLPFDFGASCKMSYSFSWNTVVEHYVLTLLSFFTAALIGGLVDYLHVSQGATILLNHVFFFPCRQVCTLSWLMAD